MYLKLFHGGNFGEDLDGWGEHGPVFGPFPFFHTTYADRIKFGDDCELRIVEDVIHYDGVYYGDWSCFEDAVFEASADLRAHHAVFDPDKATPPQIQTQATVELYLVLDPRGWRVSDLGESRAYTSEDDPLDGELANEATAAVRRLLNLGSRCVCLASE